MTFKNKALFRRLSCAFSSVTSCKTVNKIISATVQRACVLVGSFWFQANLKMTMLFRQNPKPVYTSQNSST